MIPLETVVPICGECAQNTAAKGDSGYCTHIANIAAPRVTNVIPLMTANLTVWTFTIERTHPTAPLPIPRWLPITPRHATP